MDQDEAFAMLHLLAAGGATRPRRQLLQAHGTAVAALGAGPCAWRAAGLSGAQRAILQAPAGEAQRRTRGWLEGARHHLLAWTDADYPPLLRDSPSPPLALFACGQPALLWHPAVAVVGSRRPTAGGRDNARAFAQAFARAGLGVTSGMAAGIDTAAHLGALTAGGPTVAVLGTGIDVPYPRANGALHARIGTEGVVVSEHPPGTGVRPEQFPSRNRILAALALGTLVVEAAERSGALITARLAADAGRDVFAVPGSIHNPMARGCHRLLRDGAALATCADDVVAALAPMAASLGRALRERLDAPTPATGPPPPPDGCRDIALGADYNRLWDALGHDPTGMDQLVERSGLTVAELSSMLLVMELEGRVAVAHGRYSRQSCHHAPAGAGRGK